MYFRKVIYILLLMGMPSHIYAQVGIGTTTPDESSILDVSSNSKGVLIPRMTEINRDLITNPAQGLMIYCTNCCTEGRLSFYSTEWNVIPPCPPPNEAPVISLATITGTLEEDQEIKASYSYSDTENDLPGNHSFRWFRSDDISGTNLTLIIGASDSLYTLTADDVGKFMQYTIVPSALTGTTPGAVVTSSYSGLVIPSTPVTLEIPSGNFDNGGNGGSAQHEDDVDYPTLFNGDTVNSDNRFHEGDYIDITFSTPTNTVLLSTDCIVKVYWYHNGDNKLWGVYTTFFDSTVTLNTVNDGPFTSVEQERVLVASPSAVFNKIRVGAISTGVGGEDARIREIDIIRPDGSEIVITVN